MPLALFAAHPEIEKQRDRDVYAPRSTGARDRVCAPDTDQRFRKVRGRLRVSGHMTNGGQELAAVMTMVRALYWIGVVTVVGWAVYSAYATIALL
jgi:hypothetical protein